MVEFGSFRAQHIEAEEKVRQAFRLLGDARTVMTIWELEQFIRAELPALGHRGFVNSIGECITQACVIDSTPSPDGK